MLCYFQGLKDPGEHEALFSLLPLKQGYTIKDVKICSSSLWQLLRRSGVVHLNDVGNPFSQAGFLKNGEMRSQWWAEVLDMDKVKALKPHWQYHQ